MITFRNSSALLLCAALLLPAYSAAQDDEEPSYFSVRTMHVNPGQGERFRELQGQLTQAAGAAERQPRAVYQEIRGQLGTYYNVTGIENFAQYDEDNGPPMEEEAWTEWLAAMGEAGRSSSLVVYRQYPGLSIAPSDDAGPPGLIVLRFTRVKAGQGGAFTSWVRDELKPALENGGSQGVNFSRAVLGADPNLWVSGSRIDNWAALDGPGPLDGLSDEERQALFEGWGDMVDSQEIRVIRFLPNISTPPAD